MYHHGKGIGRYLWMERCIMRAINAGIFQSFESKNSK
jgi:hypothetical protein